MNTIKYKLGIKECKHNFYIHKIFGILMLSMMVFTQANAEEDWPEPVQGQTFSFFILDQLEHRWNDGPDTYVWDAQGWIGSDYNKLWIKTEGEYQPSRNDKGDAELQLLYSRLIKPFWDFQMGLRYDQLYGDGPNRGRTLATVGVQGLAPYVFEVEPALFLSDDGDFSARFTGSYDLLLTQRLILQPRLEINVAAQDDKKFGIGSGLNNVQLDLRLRYEIRREFAPYVGFSWTNLYGETKDLARNEGEVVNNFAAIAGLRIWF